MPRVKFFKLGKQATVFYDPKNRLKVTSGVPAKTDNISKATTDAVRTGHLIEIGEDEYSKAIDKLPTKTKIAILHEQKGLVIGHKEEPKKEEPKKEPKKEEPKGVKAKEEDDDDDDDDDEDEDEKVNLLKRLKKLNLKKAEHDTVAKYSNEDLTDYLEENE